MTDDLSDFFGLHTIKSNRIIVPHSILKYNENNILVFLMIISEYLNFSFHKFIVQVLKGILMNVVFVKMLFVPL